MIVYLNGEPMAWSDARTLAAGLEPVCVLHKNHAPRPLRLVAHHVHPLGHGGPDTRGNLAVVCDNGHAAVHEILRILLAGKPLPPYFGTRASVVPVPEYACDPRVVAVDGLRVRVRRQVGDRSVVVAMRGTDVRVGLPEIDVGEPVGRP